MAPQPSPPWGELLRQPPHVPMPRFSLTSRGNCHCRKVSLLRDARSTGPSTGATAASCAIHIASTLRWALLKSLENENLTPKQLVALQELVADQSATSDAWVIKEKLRWIQKAPTPRAARWRITNYLKVMQAAVSEKSLLKPMGKALATLERHADAVVRRWLSGLTNARLEGMNGLFQAARSRARGYRNEANFIAMIYLIGSPVGRLFDQAKST